jgi:hypothetical protein
LQDKNLILEAFAKYLQAADPKVPATDVLAQWLWRHLSSEPKTNVEKVLHCEMTIREIKKSRAESSASGDDRDKPKKTSYVFCGTSSSGKRLLKSLYEYCQSYEQARWARFIHTLKASDFSEKLLGR